MPKAHECSRLVRFERFELDLLVGELRTGTARIRLQDKSFRMLRLLLEKAGEVVTRKEIQDSLWTHDTVVEFDHGIATALKKLRRALGDDAANPRYIETLARRGYRWMAGVEWEDPDERQDLPSPAEKTIDSIAVLPFTNLSANPEQEYFCAGLAEEILNALTRIQGLKVIARTSSFAFSGKGQDIRQIGQALKVSSVLQGSVRHAGSRVRVSVQLIDARTDKHLWSETYDRSLSDIFSTQDEIAAAIGGALEFRLPSHAAAVRYEPVFAAYEAHLKGRYYSYQITPEAALRARKYFQQAIALDSRYADPHYELGTSYIFLCISGLMAPNEALATIRTHAQAMLEISPTSFRAHALLGFVTSVADYDWEASERHFRQALSERQVPPDVRHCMLFSTCGTWDAFTRA